MHHASPWRTCSECPQVRTLSQQLSTVHRQADEALIGASSAATTRQMATMLSIWRFSTCRWGAFHSPVVRHVCSVQVAPWVTWRLVRHSYAGRQLRRLCHRHFLASLPSCSPSWCRDEQRELGEGNVLPELKSCTVRSGHQQHDQLAGRAARLRTNADAGEVVEDRVTERVAVAACRGRFRRPGCQRRMRRDHN